jgi:asparagine synthase (glutamine-hydrolysing)
VLLDGQGADELFAGYLAYAVLYLSDLRKRDPLRWPGEFARFATGVYPRFFASQSLREFGARAFHYFTRGRAPVSILSPEMEALSRQHQSSVPPRELNTDDTVNRFLYRTLVRDSIPSLLHYEDRNSMAYSIEARVPFLDHRLAEFVMGVPASQKVRGAETKVFMRRALRGILPDEIVNRKDKLGYPTPFSQWLRGPLRNEVETFLNDTAFKRDWYLPRMPQKLWSDHLNGARNNDAAIYRMISAELWYRQHTAN